MGLFRTIFLFFVVMDDYILEKSVQHTELLLRFKQFIENFCFLSPSFHGEYPLCPKI